MNPIFEVISWLAVLALLATSIPQMILNYRRKSSEGISWLMFLLLLFGMASLFFRSLLTTSDLIIRLNYGVGALIVFVANLQIFYYRKVKK